MPISNLASFNKLNIKGFSMLGIEEIASYIPIKRVSNHDRKIKFAITDDFITEKIGVDEISIMDENEDCSDLCVKAYENLKKKIAIKDAEIDTLVVVTQNPDYSIPQASAIVHGKLKLNHRCAAFDISLGCSGYVYALSVIQAFMSANGLKKGLLFTSDPYSKIIDPSDKNTALLFGDAAAVTLLGEKPVYESISFNYGTIGEAYRDLVCANKTLYMNGRGIVNFAAKEVPESILELLKKCNESFDGIDKILFHQASRYMINSLTKRLNLDSSKVIYDIEGYGNTVSSSIPILLEKLLSDKRSNKILISGFGVGLSWANAILKRV